MPFRDKMKKLLRRATSGEQTPTLATTKSDVEKYKPGEVPPSKYPSPWKKQNQEKLSAFSFGNAFGRRNSEHSDVSPCGTRRNSSFSFGRKSVGKDREAKHVEPVPENADSEENVANGIRRRLHLSVRLLY